MMCQATKHFEMAEAALKDKKDVLAEVHERDRTQWLYVKLWHL